MRKTPLAYPRPAQITACLPRCDGHGLVRFGGHPHLGLVSDMSSNMTARVENRYPSPLARSVPSPCGPRQLFRHAPILAYDACGCKKALALRTLGRIICATLTQQRVAKCAKQFSPSPFCPPQPSRVAWKTRTFNVPLSARVLAVSRAKSSPTAVVSPVQPSGPQAAHCSTTCNLAAARPAHRTPVSYHQRFPSALVREPFSIGASPIAAHPDAQELPAPSTRL